MVVVRLLLAVVVGVALLAATMPAVEHTRHHAAKTAAEGELSRIKATIRDLTHRSDPTRSGWSASRELAVSVPSEAVGSTGVDWIALGGIPGRVGPAEPPGTDLLAYSIGGTVTIVWLPSVELRIANHGRAGHGDPLVLRSAAILEFTYERGDHGPVVVVRAERL